MNNIGRLLVRCDDKPGIVAAISAFFENLTANITALDQHATDAQGGCFFLRLEFQMPELAISQIELERNFEREVAARFKMQWHISYSSQRLRTVLLVSRHDHALLELLWLWKKQELEMDIVGVVSNHPDLKGAVRYFDIPFIHIPVLAATKAAAEAQLLELIKDKVDLIILARYMQILSADFVAHFSEKIINIHHSFLPAFIGADPYQQAYDRGVKIIGATAHYVTADLDEGPIIHQEVAAVSHKYAVDDLRRLGRSLERHALAQAVRWHLEDRIIVDNHKTIVFN